MNLVSNKDSSSALQPLALQNMTTLDVNSKKSTASKVKAEWQKNAIRVCGNWSEQMSSKGKIYFYNCVTEVSQWQKPCEWTLPEMSHPKRSRNDSGVESNRPSPSKRIKYSNPSNSGAKNSSTDVYKYGVDSRPCKIQPKYTSNGSKSNMMDDMDISPSSSPLSYGSLSPKGVTGRKENANKVVDYHKKSSPKSNSTLDKLPSNNGRLAPKSKLKNLVDVLKELGTLLTPSTQSVKSQSSSSQSCDVTISKHQIPPPPPPPFPSSKSYCARGMPPSTTSQNIGTRCNFNSNGPVNQSNTVKNVPSMNRQESYKNVTKLTETLHALEKLLNRGNVHSGSNNMPSSSPNMYTSVNKSMTGSSAVKVTASMKSNESPCIPSPMTPATTSNLAQIAADSLSTRQVDDLINGLESFNRNSPAPSSQQADSAMSASQPGMCTSYKDYRLLMQQQAQSNSSNINVPSSENDAVGTRSISNSNISNRVSDAFSALQDALQKQQKCQLRNNSSSVSNKSSISNSTDNIKLLSNILQQNLKQLRTTSMSSENRSNIPSDNAHSIDNNIPQNLQSDSYRSFDKTVSSFDKVAETSKELSEVDRRIKSLDEMLKGSEMQKYVDHNLAHKYADVQADRLENEAQLESKRFNQLQGVLFSELSCELKKLRALVRISEAKLSCQETKERALTELMDMLEARKPLPNLSFSDGII